MFIVHIMSVSEGCRVVLQIGLKCLEKAKKGDWCLWSEGHGEISNMQAGACVVSSPSDTKRVDTQAFLACPHMGQKRRREGWALQYVIS